MGSVYYLLFALVLWFWDFRVVLVCLVACFLFDCWLLFSLLICLWCVCFGSLFADVMLFG